MATRKSKSKEIVRWDDELAKQAEIAAAMEANTSSNQFFSIKNGTLSWQDSPLPNNEMAVIILDFILENIYYENSYDPDVPQSPTCFAFNRNEDDLEPHAVVREAGQNQSTALCDSCEHNKFGSANKGKGKACGNVRRLAMIPAGQVARDKRFELFEDSNHYNTAQIGFMRVPVTSVKGYSAFVKKISNVFKRPPFGVITQVSVVPDQRTQFKVTFEPLEKVPDTIMSIIMKRHEEVMSTIDFPYQLGNDEETPPRSRAVKKPKARGSRKY